MKNGFLFLLLFIFSKNVFSQTTGATPAPPPPNCIRVEGKSIGCVPSSFDTCHSGQPFNCEVIRATSRCLYIQALDKYWVDPDGGPMAFQCATYDNTKCNQGNSDVPSCPQATCVEYKKPICKKRCKLGYKGSAKEYQVPRKGCKRFCGEFCANEPQCDMCDPNTNPNCVPRQVCPLKHPLFPSYILPRPQVFDAWKPDTSPFCASKALDPLGREHDVDQDLAAREASCPSTKLEPETRIDVDESCFWIKYPGKPNPGDPAKDGCNPNNLKPGNRFPLDCTVALCGKPYCDENPGKCK